MNKKELFINEVTILFEQRKYDQCINMIDKYINKWDKLTSNSYGKLVLLKTTCYLDGGNLFQANLTMNEFFTIIQGDTQILLKEKDRFKYALIIRTIIEANENHKFTNELLKMFMNKDETSIPDCFQFLFTLHRLHPNWTNKTQIIQEAMKFTRIIIQKRLQIYEKEKNSEVIIPEANKRNREEKTLSAEYLIFYLNLLQNISKSGRNTITEATFKLLLQLHIKYKTSISTKEQFLELFNILSIYMREELQKPNTEKWQIITYFCSILLYENTKWLGKTNEVIINMKLETVSNVCRRAIRNCTIIKLQGIFNVEIGENVNVNLPWTTKKEVIYIYNQILYLENNLLPRLDNIVEYLISRDQQATQNIYLKGELEKYKLQILCKFNNGFEYKIDELAYEINSKITIYPSEIRYSICQEIVKYLLNPLHIENEKIYKDIHVQTRSAEIMLKICESALSHTIQIGDLGSVLRVFKLLVGLAEEKERAKLLFEYECRLENIQNKENIIENAIFGGNLGIMEYYEQNIRKSIHSFLGISDTIQDVILIPSDK